jgi:hypothetical protein
MNDDIDDIINGILGAPSEPPKPVLLPPQKNVLAPRADNRHIPSAQEAEMALTFTAPIEETVLRPEWKPVAKPL